MGGGRNRERDTQRERVEGEERLANGASIFSLSPRTITSVWPRPLLALLIKVKVYRFLCECVYVHVRAQGGVPAILSTCSRNPIKALVLWGLVVLPSARPTAHLKTPSIQNNCHSDAHICINTWNKCASIYNRNASEHMLLHLSKMWRVWPLSWPVIITLGCWQPFLWPPGPWSPLTEPSMLCSDNQSVKRHTMLAPAGLHVASLVFTNPSITYSSSLYSLNCSHSFTNLHLNVFWSPYMAAGKPTKDQFFNHFQLHNLFQALLVGSHVLTCYKHIYSANRNTCFGAMASGKKWNQPLLEVVYKSPVW